MPLPSPEEKEIERRRALWDQLAPRDKRRLTKKAAAHARRARVAPGFRGIVTPLEVVQLAHHTLRRQQRLADAGSSLPAYRHPQARRRAREARKAAA